MTLEWVRSGRFLLAVEVKAGNSRAGGPGLTAFVEIFHPDRTLLVGVDGIPLADFLSEPVEAWL